MPEEALGGGRRNREQKSPRVGVSHHLVGERV